jgi:hypothetical protein
MPSPSPLSCLPPGARSDHAAALAELRAAIHRATAGHVAHRERAERERFNEGVCVSETSIRCWAAMVGPLVGPLRLPGIRAIRSPS